MLTSQGPLRFEKETFETHKARIVTFKRSIPSTLFSNATIEKRINLI